MNIVSVRQMRQLDQQAINDGTPAGQLMEKAGRGAFEQITGWLAKMAPEHRQTISVLAGKGNNGGDAHVVARLLALESEFKPVVYSVCSIDELTGEARLNAERLPEQVPFIVCRDRLPEAALDPSAVIVDGLLGTGIGGAPREPAKTMIRQVNQASRPVAALDLPSGLDGDTGETAGGLAIQADLTITMGLPKAGFFTLSGRSFCGRMRVVDIGLPKLDPLTSENCGKADFLADIAVFLGRRNHGSHKNSCGHVLVIAGSPQYIGAPALVARGALVSGAGLVTVAVPEGLWTRTPCPALPAALIVQSVTASETGYLCADAMNQLTPGLEKASAVAFGPGVGRQPETPALLAALLKSGKPTVIDADGLNLIATNQAVFTDLLQASVLTPHPGEMARLLRGFKLPELLRASRIEQATGLARATGATIVLKGPATVTAVPKGDYWLNSSGDAALATAGTGDILTGLISGFIAQGQPPEIAARTAVFSHGLAGEINRFGVRALTADEMPEAITEALKKISPFA